MPTISCGRCSPTPTKQLLDKNSWIISFLHSYHTATSCAAFASVPESIKLHPSSHFVRLLTEQPPPPIFSSKSILAMKFTAAASILFALANGADAFVVPGTSRTASISALRASPSADPYESMLVAITNSADAASIAAKTSSDLTSSLSSNSFDIASNIMTPEAISAAQAKLSILESNIATSSDPAVMSKAIIDALDMSIQAAEHAVDSTSILTANLANFDTVLSNSISIHSFHLLPPETAEVARANMAALLYNLGGLSI